jgi:hypothetical protein
MSELNFDIAISLRKIYIGVTGERDDTLTNHQTMLEIGVENQNVNILKIDHKCRASVFGASITTLSSYELLYVFVNKLKKVSSIYTDTLGV